jgi:ketosteroid isomerase-like protein
MKKSYLKERPSLIYLCMLFAYTTTFGQIAENPTIDLQRARVIVDSLGKQFSRYYFNGDSLALYAMYTKDASLGCLEGNALRSGIGTMIRSSIQNSSRNITYTTTSLSVDAEFIVEVGIYEARDDKGNLKDKGKYLVVYKQENDDWKLYRDLGL